MTPTAKEYDSVSVGSHSDTEMDSLFQLVFYRLMTYASVQILSLAYQIGVECTFY